MSPFAELCITTNFSFLRGASHPEELVMQAKALGLAGIGVADRNSLAGVVRAHAAAKEAGLRLAVGARLVFRDGTPDILVYPQDRAAYARLTRLLTRANRRAPKGECWLDFKDFLDHGEGLQAIVVPPLETQDLRGPHQAHTPIPGSPPSGEPGTHKLSPQQAHAHTSEFGSPASSYVHGSRTAGCAGVRERQSISDFPDYLRRIKTKFGAVWLAAPFQFDGEDRRRLRILKQLAAETGARLIASTDALHHVPERRALLDVLTCVREKTTLDSAGKLLAANAERHLKAPAEMARLYALAPEAISETVRFLQGARFSLDELSYQYPDETVAGYVSAQAALEDMAWKGADKRYPDGVPESVRHTLARELAIVADLNFAAYFLTVADIVRFAREERAILCQGRGSAANSTICYCLGVTAVNPATSNLLFERFISAERNEPPDIDIDFEHERREEVIQYVYEKYGRHRAALAATLICYRGKSAIRDVCKAFGYSEDRINALSKSQHWWSKEVSAENLRELGLDVRDARLMRCMGLVRELRGFPRHLSQHVGGFVITKDRLDEVVPVQNAAMEDRTVVEWDKDDLQELKILKVDLLGLGMLTCIRKAFDMVDAHYPDWGAHKQALTLDTLPLEDPRVYSMLQRADSIGVFQVESRAQMSMLPRLRPENFYDLVIEVAIVRPGPIQGGMVHPYLKRRQGVEKVAYPSKALEEVLQRTLGVPLFQEQAMQIAIVAAGFTPSEADKLRRAMATFRRVGTIGALKDKFINGMIANGYERDFAEASFRQIEGFGEYGFPESHAASFALLVYASSWLKCYYPDVFAAALLNAQPMGFYAPAQIVRDAAEHGVELRPPDVNHAHWDNGLEPGPDAAPRLHARHADMRADVRSTHALRLGFRQIDGVKEEDMARLIARRGRGYDSVRDLWLRAELSPAIIERLADADAFRSIGLDRRDALWAARGLNRVGGQEDLPLFAQRRESTHEPDFELPPMGLGEHVVEDYRTLRLSLKTHPAALLRNELAARGVIAAQELSNIKDGRRVRVAGLVLVRQRPGTASGVIFMTLEDETHIANIVVWPKTFERYRAEVLGARLCAVDGLVQSERGVVHVVAERIHDFSPLLARLSAAPLEETLARADETRKTSPDPRTHPRKVRHDLAASVMPKGRNFH